MTSLVAYYSRTGNNERLAHRLRGQLPGCDLDRIVDTQPRDNLFRAALDALLRRHTPIQYRLDPAVYDEVIVVTPFWAGRLPPATRTYLSDHAGRLRRLAVLSVSGQGEANRKALLDIAGLAGLRPFASLLVSEADLDVRATDEQLANFVAQLGRPGPDAPAPAATTAAVRTVSQPIPENG
jgi:hypothetical protein